MDNIMDLTKVIFIVLLLPVAYSDNFRFASHYADHMVLQRDPSRAIIWGFGEKGAPVNVSLYGKTYRSHVFVDSRGLNTWKVVLDPVGASGPYDIEAVSREKGKEVKLSLKDVYFGDVWVCGGQSNMQFTVPKAFKGAEELAMAGRYQKVRLFTVQRYNSKTPVPELNEKNILQQWSIASRGSLGDFSAICWMYGRRLYDLYNVPIGLISTNYGGTSVEAWSSPSTLAQCGITSVDSDRNMHSGLWNAMLYPFLNTTIYGVIWYQGEENAYKPQTYNCTFPAMIKGWRDEWFEGTGGYSNYYFPFGFVQLSALGDDVIIDGFPIIRWKQTAEYGFVPNLKQPYTFMAVAMDLLDLSSPYGSIHPRDKTTVVERLLLGGRAIAYKEDDVYWTGPIVDRVEVIVFSMEKTQMIVVHYNPSSLLKDGIEVRNYKGFEVLFANSSLWTSVEISYVSHAFVSMRLPQSAEEIIAIRYAWDQKPCMYKQCAIYAKGKDFPSPPFIKNGPFPTSRYLNKLTYMFSVLASLVTSV